MTPNLLSVLVVGCGNIGGAFDQNGAPSDEPRTHAGAYRRDGRFKIAACVEPDSKRRSEFMEAWGVSEGFPSVADAIAGGGRYDVISICSPTAFHTSDLSAALQFAPRMIFCEKPVTESLVATEAVLTACANAGVPVAVNYTRRWDRSITELRDAIASGQRGTLRSVTGLYNKGILNNGSHMVDLLLLLLGPMMIVHVGAPVYDHVPTDASIPVWLESSDGVPVFLGCGDARDYSLFELEFVFSTGMLTMEDGGLFWRERTAGESDVFKGYRALDSGTRTPGGYSQAMRLSVDNIYRTLKQQDALASSGESALATQRLCERVRELAGESR